MQNLILQGHNESSVKEIVMKRGIMAKDINLFIEESAVLKGEKQPSLPYKDVRQDKIC